MLEHPTAGCLTILWKDYLNTVHAVQECDATEAK